MIKRIKLKNFKSHEDTDIELENLTILCGQNGVGKSSIIQSLLLLRQTYQKNKLDEILDLNEPLCKLGTSKDLFYQYGKEDLLSIALDFEEFAFKWQFFSNDDLTFLEINEEESNMSDIL